MEDRVMKKTLLILGAMLALLSCNKIAEKDLEIQPEETVSNPVTFNVTVNAAETKAEAEAKSAWADGDVIYVVFNGITTKYLTLTYNSASWTSHASSDFSVSDFVGKDLKLTAVHFPMVVTPALNAGVLSFTSGGGPAYSYYLKQTGAEYTIEGTTVNVSLALVKADGYAQFHIPGIQAGISDYTFQATGVRPVACSYIIASSGAITENEATVGSALKGFADAEGGVFSARIVNPGTDQDYTFTLTNTSNTYTFSKNRSLAANTFYRFPALSDSKWAETATSSVPQPESGMLATPLTFEAKEKNTNVSFTLRSGIPNDSVQYSTDGASWSNYTSGTQITLTSIGDKVMFRGNNEAYYFSDNSSTFSITKGCYVYGNVMSLVNANDYMTKTVVGELAFRELFMNCTNLYNHPMKDIVLPATQLGNGSYCVMFRGCTNLTRAPELPATTLSIGCYRQMFYGCTSLTAAPVLPATTLVNLCYSCMFTNCTVLNSVTCLATYISASRCTENWLLGVASSGKFTRAATMHEWTPNVPDVDYNGIPTGWTVDPPLGALSGKFSVSSTQKVYFSESNLQDFFNDWFYSVHQWYYYGTDNNVDTYRDLFGWGTSGQEHGAVAYQPYSTSTDDSEYYAYGNASNNLYDNPGTADWGYNAINYGGSTENSGWRTPKKEEWDYLLNTRTNATVNNTANARWTLATISIPNDGNFFGLIIFPDNYAGPTVSTSDISWGTINAHTTASECTSAGWTELEEAGCTFLPAAGYRYGTVLSGIGTVGRYWSSTHYDKDDLDAYSLSFGNGVMEANDHSRRHLGYSVRLIMNVQ